MRRGQDVGPPLIGNREINDADHGADSSFNYAAVGTGIGKALQGGNVGLSASTIDMPNPNMRNRFFFMPGAKNGYLFQAEFKRSILMFTGEAVLGGGALIFVGCGPNSKVLIDAALMIKNSSLGLSPVWGIAAIVTAIFSFKAVGVYLGMQAGANVGLSLLTGQIW